MTPADLLAHARSLGLHLHLEGDRIRIRPEADLTPELRQAISDSAPEIAQLLQAEQGICGTCGKSSPILVVDDQGVRTCAPCRAATFRRRGRPRGGRW